MSNSKLFLDVKFITTENLDKDTEFVYQGHIFNNSNRDELLVKGVPVCKEVKSFSELSQLYLDEPKVEQENQTFKNKFRVREFLDGTMLRVYYDKELNEWKLSTNRCLDAFMSKWSNMYSFGEYFKKLLVKKLKLDGSSQYMSENMNIDLSKIFDEYLSLNNDFIYYFLIGSTDMKVVEPIDEDYIYLLYVLEGPCESIPTTNNFNVVDVIVPYISYVPCIDYDFATMDLCLSDIKRGLLIENDNKRYVWFVEEYQKKRKQYGRNKYLGLTLIELMDKHKYNSHNYLADEYFVLNPDHKDYCKDIEKAKLMFCRSAHSTYKKRYIQKQIVKVKPELHFFVKKLYEKYITQLKETKTKSPTLLKDVIEFYDNHFNKYSKFIFIRSYLSQLNLKLTGNHYHNLNKKNNQSNTICNSSNNKSNFVVCESEFPPLTNS
jgi:hypothetical protein